MAVKRNSGFRSHSRKRGQCLLGISRATFGRKERIHSLSLFFLVAWREILVAKMAGKLGPFRENRILTLEEMCSWEIVGLIECRCFMIREWIISVIKTVDFSSVSSIVINREWRNLKIEIVSWLLINYFDRFFFFDNT